MFCSFCVYVHEPAYGTRGELHRIMRQGLCHIWQGDTGNFSVFSIWLQACDCLSALERPVPLWSAPTGDRRPTYKCCFVCSHTHTNTHPGKQRPTTYTVTTHACCWNQTISHSVSVWAYCSGRRDSKSWIAATRRQRVVLMSHGSVVDNLEIWLYFVCVCVNHCAF